MVVVLGHLIFMSNTTVNAQEGSIGLVVNGQNVQNMPTPPVIRQDRMLVPARAVFESLGATVEWYPDTRAVYIQYQDKDVVVTIDRTILMVNGHPTEMPVSAQIINGNTMIPVAAVAENLGFDVDFRDRTVFVNAARAITPDNTQNSDDDVPLDEVYFTSGNTQGSDDDVPLDEVYFTSGNTQDSDDDVPLDDAYFNSGKAQGSDDDDNDEYEFYEYDGVDDEDVYRYDDEDNVTTDPEPQPPSSAAPLTFIPNPIPASMVLPARDVSTVQIPVISYPDTTIVFAGMMDPNNQVYTIMASSPITGVERTLLADNRLALDIVNSTTTLSGALPVPSFMSVSGLRVSQFTENTTRVVFDLDSGTEFSITISTCRTTITLTINQHTLQDFTFEAADGQDNIVLSGIRSSAVRVQPGNERLWILLGNTQSAINVDTLLEGSFATHATLHRWGSHATLLELTVNNFTAHSIIQTGPNETTIRLHPATYRGILYNFTERTFRIPKSDGFTMSIDQIGHFDQYHQRRYVLRLPLNALDHLGFGDIFIGDVLLHYVSISHNVQGTQLTFNGNQIFSLVVEEDAESYLIRILNPRERYPRIVIIDPGHGGPRPGTIRGGIRETDLNLQVTHKLLQLIAADGFIRAYTTRITDVALHELNPADLRARADFGNHFGDMFISIHHNSVTNTAIHGIETFYRETIHDSFRMLTSRNLADIMHRHKLVMLGSHDRRVRSENFAVLRYSTIPAALVELGFMSNPQELAKMTTPEFQWQAARAIYNGLLEAFMWIPER